MRVRKLTIREARYADLEPKGFVGECAEGRKKNTFVLRIDARQSPEEKILTEIHELAHMTFMSHYKHTDEKGEELFCQRLEEAAKRFLKMYREGK